MGLRYPLEGGCDCGQLRYRVNAAPLAVVVCHCNQCKRRTGTAFSLNMPTMRSDFEVTAGDSTTAEFVGGSGAAHRHHICPQCRIRVYSEMLAYPDIVSLRTGTLYEPQAVAPVAQVWTRVALPWAIIPELKSFEENPADFPPLIAEWRAAHACAASRPSA